MTAAIAVGSWMPPPTRQRSTDYPVGDDDDALFLASTCSVHPSAAVAAVAVAAVTASAAAIDVAVAGDDAARTTGAAVTCAVACSDDGSRPRSDLDYYRPEPNSAPMYLRWQSEDGSSGCRW